MPDFDAIIIGAGNGGLTAATTLAKSGVNTLLLEQHNVPGGCATSFVRGRFEFEVALHQLSGLGTEDKPGPLKGLFAKLGVLDKLEFVEEHDIYRTWVPGQLSVTLPADRKGTIEALIARFPAEQEGIKRLFALIYQFAQDMFKGIYGRDPEFGAQKYPAFCNYALRDSQSVMDEFVKNPLLQLTCYDLADTDFSPQGCSQVSLINMCYADHWLALPPESYHEAKYEYASHMLDIAERMHPGFRNALEEVEVSTPLTHMNYLRTPGGAIYGFDQMAKDNNMFISHRSPLKGLYHAGAWVGIGGFQPTLESGMQAAKAIVKVMQQ